ncbi:hypothetical protein Taro_004790 [Colocasia esculenta]|uniref:Uncharacterized protein n=1 Tax=Colocasia esculenta TaxID=4460 RepID=A0A843TL67_COLES|nr:hypothetical protein [Colocasia esculenta]
MRRPQRTLQASRKVPFGGEKSSSPSSALLDLVDVDLEDIAPEELVLCEAYRQPLHALSTMAFHLDRQVLLSHFVRRPFAKDTRDKKGRSRARLGQIEGGEIADASSAGGARGQIDRSEVPKLLLLSRSTWCEITGSSFDKGKSTGAYQRLVWACRLGAVGGSREGASSDGFMQVHATYATFSDPNKCAEYDHRMVTSIAAHHLPPFHYRPSSFASYYSPLAAASSSSPSPRFPPWMWDTDQCW